MTTTVNNTVANNTVVVANNVANNEDGYNANVTNEVVVLNGDTFYKKNMVEGQKYRYEKHYFVIDKFETRGTHLYYCGTLDNKPFEGDLHSLKVACECTERRQKNASANDTENGKAVKVKRTSKETADSIERKYNSVRDLIKLAVGKLPENEDIISAMNGLLLQIELVRNGRVTALLDAEKAKRDARLVRIAEIEEQLPILRVKVAELFNNGDLDEGINLGKAAKEMKTELEALQAEEAAYIASLAPASEDAEDAEEDNK